MSKKYGQEVGPMQFKVVGVTTATTVHCRNQDWKERVRLLDSMDTSSSGEAFEAGPFGGTYSLEAFFDPASLPHATAPGIRAGAKADITVPIGGSTSYTIPIIVEETGPTIPVGELMSYRFTARYDGSSGRTAYTRAG